MDDIKKLKYQLRAQKALNTRRAGTIKEQREIIKSQGEVIDTLMDALNHRVSEDS